MNFVGDELVLAIKYDDERIITPLYNLLVIERVTTFSV